MVPLFPVMALLMTLSIAFIARGRKGIMLLFAGILIFTNLLSVLPRYAVEWDPERAAVRSYLLEYIHELTHETRGPIRGIVEYLRENSEAGDVVLATFGDLPIKFYTGLEVHGGMSGEDLNTLDLERVRWLVVRYHSISKQPKKDLYVHEFIRSSFRVNDFIKITLDVPDAMFENREDPELHAFRTPEGEPKVILYRRKK
jgi:hypothetical protein